MLLVFDQSGSGIPSRIDGSVGLSNSKSPNFLDYAAGAGQIKSSSFSLDLNNEN